MSFKHSSKTNSEYLLQRCLCVRDYQILSPREQTFVTGINKKARPSLMALMMMLNHTTFIQMLIDGTKRLEKIARHFLLLHTNSQKLIGSRGHVTVSVPERVKFGRHHSRLSLYCRSITSQSRCVWSDELLCILWALW